MTRFALPPLAQVDDPGQAVPLIREPALVDDDARIHLPGAHSRHDLVERHHADVRVRELRREQAHEQGGCRQAARNRDRLAGQRGGIEPGPRDDERSASASEGAAAAEQSVPVAQVAVGVERNLHDVRLPRQRDAVEGVDILVALDDGRRALILRRPSTHGVKMKVSLGQGE